MIEIIKKLSEFSNKSLIVGFLDSKLNQKFSKILEKELLNKIQKKYYNNVFILNNGFKIHLICLNSDLICGFRPDFALLQEGFDYMTCFPFFSEKNTTIYVFKDNFQEINLLYGK